MPWCGLPLYRLSVAGVRGCITFSDSKGLSLNFMLSLKVMCRKKAVPERITAPPGCVLLSQFSVQLGGKLLNPRDIFVDSFRVHSGVSGNCGGLVHALEKFTKNQGVLRLDRL